VAPGDLTALLVLLVAVLPGSVYAWAFERQADAYGATRADRVLRSVAVSLGVHLLLAWPSYRLYRTVVATGTPAVVPGRLVAVGCAWLAALLLVPAIAGTVLGGLHTTRDSRRGWWLVRRLLPGPVEDMLLRVLVGPPRPPRAWDAAFPRDCEQFVTVRTIDGETFMGWFGTRSSAGTFPHEPDLLVERAWRTGANGGVDPAEPGYVLYVPPGRIASLEIEHQEAP
jgi:hypothetical protein